MISKLLSLYYHRYSRKYLIELEPETRIGAGIHFPHNGPIVINPKTKIGENCIIHPCVLLGGDRKTGAPVIGNNVFIGHGCKLIGKVVIGDYVFIAPGAIVTKDVYSDYIIGAGINNIIRTTGGRQEVERYSIKL